VEEAHPTSLSPPRGPRMRIWLLNPYGPLPGEAWRPYRFTLIARALAAEGHDVLWWTASFAHHFKRHRSVGWEDRHIEAGFSVRLVPTPSYSSNIGLRRLWFEMVYVARTYGRSRQEPPPNVVLSIEPPQCVSYLAARIAAKRGAALYIDVFDLWPEMFETLVTARLRPLVRALCMPLRAVRRRTLRRASVVTAVTVSYADVVRAAIGGASSPLVETIPIGVDAREIEPAAEADGGVRRRLGIGPNDLLAVYAGSLGERYDLDSVIQAARLLHSSREQVHIVLVGDGPLRPRVEAAAQSLPNLHYLGVFTPADLRTLYSDAEVGLCPYGEASTVALPTKAFDYFAAGLPILSSLGGEFARLLVDHQAGELYTAASPTTLAARLKALACDRRRLGELSANSRTLADQYATRALYPRFVSLIAGVTDHVCEQRAKPAS
jgi:glycosyltransferase involved in cell wall biosynthesis